MYSDTDFKALPGEIAMNIKDGCILTREGLGEAKRLKVALKIYLGVDDSIVGSSGIIGLLKEIEKEKSIRKAALKIGLNYRKAWSKLYYAEKKLGIRLVEKGKGRQGSKLTKEAHYLLKIYDYVVCKIGELEREIGLPISLR